MKNMNIKSIDNIEIMAEILFVCMSFENIRWKSFLDKNKDKYKKIVLFYNYEFKELYKEDLGLYKEDSKFEILETFVSSPIKTSDKYLEVISKYNTRDIDIDCSTFTHEHLLILFKVFSFLDYTHKLNIIYSRVNKYLVGTTNGWLSKGIKEIRNVLGYSGNFFPTKYLHLIVLVGLENERIQKIIEEFEPSKITIGKCTQESSTSYEISESNRNYHEEIDIFCNNVVSNFTDKEEFEFSCDTPEETYEVLNKVVNNNQKYNNIIVAANSKISTLGVAKLALINEDIQLIYAQPLEYNIDSYTNGIRDYKYYEVVFV